MDYVRPLASMLDVRLTLEPGFSTLEDLAFLDSANSLYLLGDEYSPKDVEAIKQFSRSIIWFTYRKNWPAPIGGFGGPTSDKGWGCMIRCGQMLLAKALTRIHLGANWHWHCELSKEQPTNEQFQIYRRLLRMFQDKRTAQFSIHQIAQFGISEGKQPGEWFGPNSMAQVLKKLVVYDEWSRLVVHVAMDNLLISADVRIMASQMHKDFRKQTGSDDDGTQPNQSSDNEKSVWNRPLLLIIPLRLGLTAINQCYLNAIIEYFKLPQCVGILGGWPNHAVYFYGSAGKKLLYLDPHVCQEFRDLDTPPPSFEEEPCNLAATTSSSGNTDGGFSDPELFASSAHRNALLEMMPSPPDEMVSTLDAFRSTTSPMSRDDFPPAHLLLSASPCSSVSSLNQQNQEAAISFPTSSSISKISSRSGGCSPPPTTSEPELSVVDTADDSLFTEQEAFSAADRATLTNSSFRRDDEKKRWATKSTSPDELTAMERSGRVEKKNGRRKSRKSGSADALLTETRESAFEKAPAANGTSSSSSSTNQHPFDDTTYHCPYLLTMDFKSLDPSLALGFLVHNYEDYEDLVHRLKTFVLPSSSPQLFEVIDCRPRGWPKFTPFETPFMQDDALNIKEYDDLQYDSDEQFELLE